MADRPTFAPNPSTAHYALNGWNSHIYLKDLNKLTHYVLEITCDTLSVPRLCAYIYVSITTG